MKLEAAPHLHSTKEAKASAGREHARIALEEKQILEAYSAEEREALVEKRNRLSGLGYMIADDFSLPIFLNKPGAGWHWDSVSNYIRIDPTDLMEKPMDMLRFLISHEAGHRRISRPFALGGEERKQKGFPVLYNMIEDPRDNSFVAANYPHFGEEMKLAYDENSEVFEQEAREAAAKTTGYTPRFLEAGFEYIKQWYRESQGMPFDVSSDLDPDARTVVEKTLPAASRSWSTYPTLAETKKEAAIQESARKSLSIMVDEVWPAYQELVAKDMADQKLMRGAHRMSEQGMPKEFTDTLSAEERREMGWILEGVRADPREWSPSLKEKVRDYVEKLSDTEQAELDHEVDEAMEELEEMLESIFMGHLVVVSDEEAEEEPEEVAEITGAAPGGEPEPIPREEDPEGAERMKEALEKLMASTSDYERAVSENLPLIQKMEQDLRQIFVERRTTKWETGFRSGKRINMGKRIQEKAKGVSAFESRAWEKRNMPSEKDYAISLLVDLSGSMRSNDKIKEAFKAMVILSETLNRLSIKLEVNGFNSEMHEYLKFGDSLDSGKRKAMGGMLSEVSTSRSMYNDDGWALQEANARLSRQAADQRFLIILSDGSPAPSSAHSGPEYNLTRTIGDIISEGQTKLIGVGVGSGTGHVKSYYPKSIADVSVEELAGQLAGLIKDVIEHYDKF